MIRPHLEVIVVDPTRRLVPPRDQELTQRIVARGVLGDALYPGRAELFRLSLVRPVAGALLLAPLVLLGGHDNHPCILLPDHVPEIRHRVHLMGEQAALGGDICFEHFPLPFALSLPFSFPFSFSFGR